jgi:uncharacterized protein
VFHDVITSLDELRALVGEPSELARAKQLAALDVHCRSFIAHAPFLLMATANAAGHCDVSPKGDAPGFVRVLDDHHLVVPDRPGNKRLDGMRNILENPNVGLIFLVPGVGETLRVNGRASIVRDPEVLAACAVDGKQPLLAIAVEVRECFLHCAKALRRSHLWEPAAWPDVSGLAPRARMFFDQAKPAGMTVEDLECRLQTSYTTGLY